MKFRPPLKPAVASRKQSSQGTSKESRKQSRGRLKTNITLRSAWSMGKYSSKPCSTHWSHSAQVTRPRFCASVGLSHSKPAPDEAKTTEDPSEPSHAVSCRVSRSDVAPWTTYSSYWSSFMQSRSECRFSLRCLETEGRGREKAPARLFRYARVSVPWK